MNPSPNPNPNPKPIGQKDVEEVSLDELSSDEKSVQGYRHVMRRDQEYVRRKVMEMELP